MSPQEGKEFREWLLEHEGSTEEDTVLKGMLEALPQEGGAVAEDAFNDFAERIGLSKCTSASRIHGLWRAICASVAGAAVAVLATLVLSRPHEDGMLRASTTFAETRTIVLEDSTTVSLGPCSEIIYPREFGRGAREVHLVGQAYFDVAKDTRRKFSVSTVDSDITVHGTRFSVESFPESRESKVALVEGSVELHFGDADGPVFLEPGEMVRHDRSSGAVERRKISAQLCGRICEEGGLQFVDERLGDIVATLSRHYGVEIVICNPAVAESRYFASFINGESVDEILEAINAAGKFTVRRRGAAFIIE